MKIRVDDLQGPEIAALLQEHLRDMRAVSPPESKHALDLEGLRKPEITFWTIWEEHSLVGCGAIKMLDQNHGEIKSMRTASAHQGRGIGSLMLEHIIKETRSRGYRKLSLETGSMKFFEPARELYKKFGFQSCAPFAGYREDPNSCFFSLDL